MSYDHKVTHWLNVGLSPRQVILKSKLNWMARDAGRYKMWGVVHFYDSFKVIFFPKEMNSSVYISHSTFPVPLASVFKSYTDPTTEFPTV